MRKRTIPFHPILIAVFPILSLYVANTDQMHFRDALGALLLALLVSGVLWIGLTALNRDFRRAAIPVSCALFMFFSFAHLLLAVKMIGLSFGHYNLARLLTEPQNALLTLIAVELLILIGIAFWAGRTRKHLEYANQFLNFTGAVLLIATLATWALPVFQSEPAPGQVTQNAKASITSLAPIEQTLGRNATPMPDIYYIILDGYGRQDILKMIYGVDNQDFIDYLLSNGFYVAREAHSNYTRTALSLASSLNFAHLNTLGEQFNSALILFDLIEDNRTFLSLQEAGYQVVLFANSIIFTSARSADIVYSPPANLNSFLSLLINNSPLSIFLMRSQYDWHRHRILYTFDHLPDVAQMPGPKFFMVHFLIPHPPFIFGLQGEPRNPQRAFSIDDASDFLTFGDRQEYIQGYSNQVGFTSAAVRTVVEQILHNSPPPVIILQGDHGPGSQTDYKDTNATNLNDRFSILNALLFPGADPTIFYPTMTPVNTFHLLFNTYFNTHYPLLEDRSFIAPTSQYYHLIDVTEQLSASPANP